MSFRWISIFALFFLIISIVPVTANASLISAISNIISGNMSDTSDTSTTDDTNSQNVPLLQSNINFNASAAIGGGDILVANDEALLSDSGPSGTLADVGDSADSGQISTYTVQSGDTLSSIAAMFGVSVNTIIWANDITGSIQPGDTLVILPVSGTIHTVVKGDTLASIAKKYNADPNEIAQFNGLAADAALTVGDSVIIPNGEGSVISNTSGNSSGVVARLGRRANGTTPYLGGSGPDYPGYYIRPIVGGRKTQGLHGYNAVDLGTPVDTPVMAAADGVIIIARTSGWNGGYGNYIAISHPNGTETVYGHLHHVYVQVGESVAQGQVIGLSGGKPGDQGAGNSTGPHLHFEVRGAVNPFGP